jgi:Secretion system C-terminal sorting domain
MKKLFTLLFACCTIIAQAQFTANNLAIIKVSSAADLTGKIGKGLQTNVVEYSTAGVATATNIDLTSPTNHIVLDDRPYAHEGQINLSSDGNYLSVVGYNSTIDAVANTFRLTEKRIARIGSNGVADLETAILTGDPATSGTGIGLRATLSADGSNFFVGYSANNGVRTKSFGDGSNSAAYHTANYRSIARVSSLIIGVTGTVAANAAPSIQIVSSGSATTIPVATISNAMELTQPIFFDVDATVSWNSTGFDLMYIADRNSGVRKYYWDGTTWASANAAGTLYNPTAGGTGWGIYSMVGRIEAGKPTLYAIKIAGANTSAAADYSGSYLIKIVDNDTRTGQWTGATGTELANVGVNAGGTNLEMFKGVAFTPGSTVSLMPIELSEFNAKANATTTLLTWTTASEKDNASFNIERSTNGTDFQTIGQVKGSGTSNVAKDYVFEDKTPAQGVNYYRLQQVDFNGKSSRSMVRSVVFGNTELVVKPTLVQDELQIVVGDERATTLQIFNIAGQRVLTAQAQGEQRINISSLPAGAYFIQTATGTTRRFVKQ